jgi:hypothetical protein
MPGSARFCSLLSDEGRILNSAGSGVNKTGCASVTETCASADRWSLRTLSADKITLDMLPYPGSDAPALVLLHLYKASREAAL